MLVVVLSLESPSAWDVPLSFFDSCDQDTFEGDIVLWDVPQFRFVRCSLVIRFRSCRNDTGTVLCPRRHLPAGMLVPFVPALSPLVSRVGFVWHHS